jgi:hypothetical protein
MKILGLEVHEHKAIPRDEAWVVRQNDDERVPRDIRGTVSVPCILTGNKYLLEKTVSLLCMVEMWEEIATKGKMRKGN